jgi:serine/threonine protein kinase
VADESHAAHADPGALTNLLAQLAAAPEGDAAAWSRELKPGEELDRFEVIRELGRGGFGAVYEAQDRELGRRVALKTLRPGRARDEWADEQLQEEARAAAALSHPGIVTLFEACTCDRGPYLVMELLRGETLEERLARGPLPVAEAVEVGLQVARALAHVHEHGLVHRDVKPGNLFLGDDGRVKLLDLGLAHLLGSPSSTGGTPAYVAPEQWRGEQVDGRADVFALGAVLFELCTGRRAFEVQAGGGAAQAPAPALDVRAPRGLSRLVARCLDQDPAARPTAAEAAAGLLEVQRRLERPKARKRLAAFVAVGIAVGIGGALLASRTRVDPLAPGADGRVVASRDDTLAGGTLGDLSMP